MVFLGEGQNRGRDGAILTPNELVLTFRNFYVCANFGENRSRYATVRVLADGQTHRQTDTHTRTQTDFIICPMLYAIAMGQKIKWCSFLPHMVVMPHTSTTCVIGLASFF